MHAILDRFSRGDVFGIHFMTGGLRLAPMSNAIVMPCIIRAAWCLRNEIFIGTPVPDELLESRKHDIQVMEHVLREVSPWIAENPEQCAPHLVTAIELVPEKGTGSFCSEDSAK